MFLILVYWRAKIPLPMGLKVMCSTLDLLPNFQNILKLCIFGHKGNVYTILFHTIIIIKVTLLKIIVNKSTATTTCKSSKITFSCAQDAHLRLIDIFIMVIKVLLSKKSGQDWLVNAGTHSLPTPKVCAKHDVIALSSCQDILLSVLTYLHDVMLLWWDLAFSDKSLGLHVGALMWFDEQIFLSN